MTRRRSSKKKSLLKHSQRRFRERYALVLNRNDLNALANICRKGEYFCFLESQSLTRKKAVVFYKGEYFPVIYHNEFKSIVTVLTFDMLNQREQEVFAGKLGISLEKMREKFQIKETKSTPAAPLYRRYF
ncbi:MAG: hypothetical protein IJF17_07375 [Thermoguttaceae bacterium]|nr:hypothetical protein [Thermoguttaceae bacterium]